MEESEADSPDQQQAYGCQGPGQTKRAKTDGERHRAAGAAKSRRLNNLWINCTQEYYDLTDEETEGEMDREGYGHGKGRDPGMSRGHKAHTRGSGPALLGDVTLDQTLRDTWDSTADVWCTNIVMRYEDTNESDQSVT